MEERTEEYRTNTEMQAGVEELSDQDWILRRLTRTQDGTIVAEFNRADTANLPTHADGVHMVA